MAKLVGDTLVSGSYIPDGAAAVTKSDTTILPAGTVALYVGTTGNVVVDTWGDDVDVTFSSVPAGGVLTGHFKRVKAATSASNIVAQYVKTR